MGNKTRNTSNLVSDNNIFVDISNDRVGIGSTQPTTKLDVVGTIKATSFSGITTAMISDYGSGLDGGYSNATLDNHINVGTANTGEVLSWNGSDYDWVVGVQTANINADTLNVSGVTTFQSTVNLGDNDRLNFKSTNTTIYGSASGLNIEAAGNNDILLNSNSSGGNGGDIILRTVEGGKVSVVGTGGVGIYHTDTALKLETTADGITVHGDATFNNVSIAGTLTYDDVTNVDSIGLVTARSGVRVTGGGLDVVGVSTFTDNIDANGDLDVDGHTELDNVNVSGVITATTFTGNGGTITNVDAVTAYSADLSTLATIADKVSGKLTYTEFDQISQVDQPAGTPRTVASGDDYDLHAAESYLSKDGKTLFVSRFNFDTQNESNVVTIYERNQSGFNYVGFITETTYANVGAAQTVTHWGPVVTSNSDGSIFAIGSPDGFGGIDARSKLWWLDHVEDDNSQSTGSQQSVHIYQKTGNKIESLGIITASQYGLSSNDLGGFLDSDGEDGFGTSLALSDDGSKLYIGAPNYFRLNPIDSTSPDFVRGRVYAFDKSGSSYNFVGIITQTRDSTHNGSDNEFGISVACSSDGNKIYIGDPQTGIHTSGHPDAFANNYEEGVVYAYDRSGSNFNCVGIISTRLFPEGNVQSFYGNSRFGFDVACSDDGNTIIISAPNIDKSSSTASNNTAGGAIHVVSRDGNTFSSSGRHIHTSADNSGLSVGSFFFGRSIACNSDASKILSGKTNYGSAGVNSFGEVFSFSRSESNLTLSEILTSPRETSGGAVYSSFVTYGSNISIDSTGDTVAIGAPGHIVPGETVTDSGAVFLFSASRQIALHGNQLTNNIGIGTANTNPTSTLDVDGTLKVSGGSTLLGDVNVGTGGTTAFFDVSSGKVGIGTSILTNGAKLSLPTLTGFDGDALFSAGNQLSDYSLWVLNDSANADPSLRQKYVRQFTFNDYTISVGSTKAFRVSNSTSFDSSIVTGPGGASDTDVAFVVNPNTSTELRYNYNKKLETTSTGIDVTGHTETDTLNVSGVSTFLGNVNIGTAATSTDLPALYLKGLSDETNVNQNPSISIGGTTTSKYYDIYVVDDPNVQYVRHYSNGFDINMSVDDARQFVVSNTVGFNSLLDPGVLDNEIAFKIVPESSTELRYNKVKKLETTGYGVTVTGGLNVSGISTFADELHVGYQKEIYFATNSDYNAFQISQNGSKQSLLKNNVTSGNILIATGNAGSGYVQITNASGSETAAKFTPGGATELHYDGTKKLETTSTGIDVSGDVNVTGTANSITFDPSTNNSKTFFIRGEGNGNATIENDDEMYVSSTHLYIQKPGGTTTMAEFIEDGAVKLNHNNITKLQTHDYGIDVTGRVETDTLNVSGISTFASDLDINADVNVSGIATAAEFVGGGSDLRNLSGTHLVSYASASDISNSALSISGISTYNEVGILTGAHATVGDTFGYSVATSADGKTIVVGAFEDEVPGVLANSGVVYVYDREGNNFNEVGILSGSYATSNNDNFGYSVATSADGKTIIVGARSDETSGTDTGVVYVFDREGNNFNQVGILTGSYASDSGDYFGQSVATSADGKTIVVGAFEDETSGTTGYGLVYVFDREGNNFNEVGTLTGSYASDFPDYFGISVATSADGKTIIVGSLRDETNASGAYGLVYVFDRDGNNFNEVDILKGSKASNINDGFGRSVATSADGKTIIVSASRDETSGSGEYGLVYIFNREGNNFNEVGILTGTYASDDQDYFGWSVATSADGKNIIVGAYKDEIGADDRTGVVYVFDQERETYVFSDADGNIGIGSPQPTTKLDVVGTIKATSFSGITTSMISDYGNGLSGGYSDTDVDTHLNTSTASSGEVLSWTGSDYDWVAQSSGGGGTGTGYFSNDQTNPGIHTTASNVGLGTTNPITSVQVNDVYGIETGTGSFTAIAGVAYTANTYTSSDFSNSEYTLFFEHTLGIQSQKVLVMDDETTAYSQEYAIMSSSDLLVSVGATIKSGNVELWVTPESGVSGIITYKFTRETII